MNKYLKFTFILVLADLITKLTANLLLPYGVAIKRISAVIFFHLSYNLTGKGSLATKYYYNNSELFFIACSVLIVSLFIFFYKKSEHSKLVENIIDYHGLHFYNNFC